MVKRKRLKARSESKTGQAGKSVNWLVKYSGADEGRLQGQGQADQERIRQ